MATSKKPTLDESIKIDAVFIKGERIIVKEMTLADYKALHRKKGWEYKTYQQGSHSYKSTEDVQTKDV